MHSRCVQPTARFTNYPARGKIVPMTDAPSQTLAVLLAAGAGSRFSGPIHKLRALLHGRPVFSHALEAMVAANIGPCLVVTGAVELGDLLGTTPQVHNPHWHSGQRSSVLCAMDYATQLDCDAIVFGLADQPFVSAQAWQEVAQCDSPLAVATYDGILGNPVRVHSSVWQEFRTSEGDPDAGLRSLMRLRPELVKEVACKGNSADIDTPEDLAQWT